MQFSGHPVSFFYPWRFVSRELYRSVMLDFRDHGAENLVIVQEWMERILADHVFYLDLLEMVRDAGMKLFEVHAPNGPHWDLSCVFEGRRGPMIEGHKRALCYAAETGCRTYTIHIGAGQYNRFRMPIPKLREAALRTLDELVPHAEKLGVVIAVENSFEPPNTPDEVLFLLEHFDSPALGCCYDAGHANVMAPAPGKRQELYCSVMKEIWDGHVVEYPDALGKLAPHVVTAHLHDNDGYRDAHALPGSGTVGWHVILAKLAACPQLVSVQSEVHCDRAENEVTPGRICRKYAELFR